MDTNTYEIRVRGIVQGVGFRPFIYRIAGELNLKGEVLNDTEGVLIRLNGKPAEIPGIEARILGESPPLSKIDSIESKEIENRVFSGFEVVESEHTDQKSAFIPPDTAICEDCRRELFDENDRRYQFPFINCTHCGPRFSIIRDIPYDREQTSMSEFPMCRDCRKEYDDPSNRRFHTEPTACPVCGPKYFLLDREKERISEKIPEIIRTCISLLEEGKIIAIKGEGGYHLAADALNDGALISLRERKVRPFKPFALMVRDIGTVTEFMELSPMEEEILLSRERPVVILKEKKKKVSALVAPGLTHLGIMLPSTPFQNLLFEAKKDMILIMTSGNISDEPIISDEDELFEKLGNVADFFLTTNRKIVQQSDDSVLFISRERPLMIRRSKGFVPIPFFSSPAKQNIFAAGSDIKNSFALSKGNRVFLSQYIGDLESPQTEKKYINTINHLKNLFQIDPDVFVSDLHPGYFSTKITDRLHKGSGGERLKIQHHHAHTAAILEENGCEEKVIGISFDGTGFGDDGNIWGGEFLIADKKQYRRAGHFGYFPLPGGEAAIHEVWRTGLSLLTRALGKDPLQGTQERTAVSEMISRKINSPLCCSVGRLFDGVSSILGFSQKISTEAEAAQLLEEAALRSSSRLSIPMELTEEKKDGPFIIDPDPLIRDIYTRLNSGTTDEDLSLIFHHSIAEVTVKAAKRLREIYNLNTISLSGGVFHNRLLLTMISEKLIHAKFSVLLPRELPFNDGAIAFGQLAVAKSQLSDERLSRSSMF